MKNLIKKSISFIIAGVLLLTLVPFLRAQTESPDDIGWPREITHERGTVIICQLQLDSFKNNVLEGRAAVSVTLKDSNEPVFGAIWFKARLETDLDNRTASILNLEIPRVRFPEASAKRIKYTLQPQSPAQCSPAWHYANQPVPGKKLRNQNKAEVEPRL